MPARLAQRPLLQLLLVIVVAALVYLPFLGTRPLDFSEGHRAVPGWTMLESHDYWHIKMFGLTYFRKPPGMPWAIALGSSVFGENPFGARIPSALAAILMGGIAWWYGRRWFGVARAYQPVLSDPDAPNHGLVSPCHAGLLAGLAQALMPLMWSPGRTAEIEMLNNLGTQLFALGLVNVLLGRSARPAAEQPDEGPFAFLRDLGASMTDILVPTLGILIAALAKGPASAPVLGGVLIGACIASRSIRTLANQRMSVSLLLAAGALTLLGMKIYLANSDPDAVREDVAGQFLWSPSRIAGVLTLIPLAFASAMPMSLGLLPGCLWRKPEVNTGIANRILPATLAWAWLCSVAILMLSGVSNARYAMPAAVLLPLLVPHAAAVFLARVRSSPSLHRVVGGPVRWACIMAMVAWWFVALTSIYPTDDQKAGPEAARQLTRTITSGELWADDAIEARPDILWAMGKLQSSLRIRWAKGPMHQGELPELMSFVLLRTDAGSQESERYGPMIRDGRLNPVDSARVRSIRLTVYQVQSPRPPQP